MNLPSESRVSCLMVPSDVREVLISLQPLGCSRLYSIQSRDGGWVCAVELEEQNSLFIRTHRIRFGCGPERMIAEMPLDSLNFDFRTSTGEPRGRAREVAFSVMGKSRVEDADGQLLGFLVSRLTSTDFLGPDGNCLGMAKREMPSGLPVFLRPARAHLVDRFVWKRCGGEPLDVRMIYGYVCILIAAEFNRG